MLWVFNRQSKIDNLVFVEPLPALPPQPSRIHHLDQQWARAVLRIAEPILQLLAYWFLTEKPYRAQIYESFLGFLTGTAGAYGGSAGRRAIGEIFKKKSE